MICNFQCQVCGGPTIVAPDSGPAYCEEHCPDHIYEYVRGEGHRCITCHAEPPVGWWED